MLKKASWMIVLALIILGAVVWVIYRINKGAKVNEPNTVAGFTLTSSAFKEGEPIPLTYTCKAENLSPPLTIIGLPAGTKSLVLIMHDPDAVSGDFTHWLMWNIPPSSEYIDENAVPNGAVLGNNGSDKLGYTGSCPPAGTGTHHYIFELYALSDTLNLPQGSDRAKLESALPGKSLAKTKLTGLFSAD